MPNGRGEVNPYGIQYYKNLIGALKLAGIEPMVTLFHWNTPMALESQGGKNFSFNVYKWWSEKNG